MKGEKGAKKNVVSSRRQAKDGDGSERRREGNSLFVFLDEDVENLAFDESELGFWVLRRVVVKRFVDPEHGEGRRRRRS